MRSVAATTMAPFGVVIFLNFPAATGLRTKRTQCTAGRSDVKRPWPVINVGSSNRRIARPTQFMLEPLVPGPLMRFAPTHDVRPPELDRAGIRHWFDSLRADRSLAQRL